MHGDVISIKSGYIIVALYEHRQSSCQVSLYIMCLTLLLFALISKWNCFFDMPGLCSLMMQLAFVVQNFQFGCTDLYQGLAPNRMSAMYRATAATLADVDVVGLIKYGCWDNYW